MKVKKKLSMITSFKRRPVIMLTPTQIAQIETLARQGMTFKQIQRMTGISRNTINKYVHRANEPLTERQKVRNALDAMQPVIQEKFFAAEGNCAVVCRQMKDEHQIDINERRMRRFYASWREELKGSGKKIRTLRNPTRAAFPSRFW